MIDHAQREPDFRDHAVEQSRRLLEQVRRQSGTPQLDATQAGISCCVEAGGDGAETMRSVRRRTVRVLAAGAALVVAGALVALLRQRLGDALGIEATWVALGAGGGVVAGVMALWRGAGTCPRVAERLVARRLGDKPADEFGPAPQIGVEDSRSAHRLKLLPEDQGVLMCFPSRGCVVVEGISHRYVIYAEDVIGLFIPHGPFMHGVAVAYRVGEVDLDVTLSPTSAWVTVADAAAGQSPQNELYRRLSESLQGEED